MVRFVLAGLSLIAACVPVLAQTPADAGLGLKIAKVPPAFYAQVPGLPAKQGVLLQAVDEKSPAWNGGLRKFDIVVAVDANPISDAKVLVQHLKTAQPGAPLTVRLFRAGQRLTLAYDPAGGTSLPDFPRGFLKPGGPPAVSVQCQPAAEGQFHITLNFFSDKSGKLESIAYAGNLDGIEEQIQVHARAQRLPDRVANLADVALKRLRTLQQEPKNK